MVSWVLTWCWFRPSGLIFRELLTSYFTVKGWFKCDVILGFIVNSVLNDTGSLTQLKIKTKWSFNEPLIRFEREMVIEFTDNTMVLDMKYYQFYFMGWIGWDGEIKINDYFGKVR